MLMSYRPVTIFGPPLPTVTNRYILLPTVTITGRYWPFPNVTLINGRERRKVNNGKITDWYWWSITVTV